MSSPAPWPELRVAAWRDTYATLQLYAQIVGKIRLALTPKTNQWWNVTLYVTHARADDVADAVRRPHVVHRLRLHRSPRLIAGQRRQRPLAAARAARRSASSTTRSSASSRRSASTSASAGAAGVPGDDAVHRRPRARAATTRAPCSRFWQALRRIEPVFQTFRAALPRQVQPGSLLLGRFDLAVIALQRPPRAPREGDDRRDAYDEEVISLGFWPGDPGRGATEAMFYSYTVPEPAGLPAARPPGGARPSTRR